MGTVSQLQSPEKGKQQPERRVRPATLLDYPRGKATLKKINKKVADEEEIED